MNFANKVVVITGASSGIGAGAAVHLSSLGAKVVLTGRNEENLKKVAEKCKSEVLAIVSDVTVEADRVTLIEETIKRFGQIDVLVNNAGIGEVGPFTSFSMEKYDSVMNTNLRSVFHLSQLATPHLIKTKGNIVNISSVGGLRPFAGFTAYCMTKAALDHFTKCLALELAPSGVRVNSVNPAFIDTNFAMRMGISEAAYKDILAKAVQNHPIGRTGTIEDTATAIAFLACNNTSSFITGTLLAVDGGSLINVPRWSGLN
jgi:NAD(P)-dependent dehydrogenase (short-subunit alcohol dehydrogenase family)